MSHHHPGIVSLRVPAGFLVLLGLAAGAGCIKPSPVKKTHYQRGVEYFDGGAYADAATEFDLACQEKAKDKQSVFNLGLAYLKDGQYAKAVEVYSEYVSLDPDNAEGFINLAFAQAGAGNTAQADASFEEAIRLDSTYAYPYCACARFHMNAGSVEGNHKAMELLDRAISVERQNSTAHYLRGVVLERLGDDTRAAADFEEAVALDDNNQQALVKAASYECAEGRHQDAVLHYVHAAVLNSKDAEAWLGAGRAYRQLNNPWLSLQSIWQAQSILGETADVRKEILLSSLQLSEMEARLIRENSAESLAPDFVTDATRYQTAIESALSGSDSK